MDALGRIVRRRAAEIDEGQPVDPIRARRQAVSGHQTGDPALLAEAILHLAAADQPPAHLLPGSDTLRLVADKIAELQADIAAWQAVTLSTDLAA